MADMASNTAVIRRVDDLPPTMTSYEDAEMLYNFERELDDPVCNISTEELDFMDLNTEEFELDFAEEQVGSDSESEPPLVERSSRIHHIF